MEEASVIIGNWFTDLPAKNMITEKKFLILNALTLNTLLYLEPEFYLKAIPLLFFALLIGFIWFLSQEFNTPWEELPQCCK